MSVRIDFDDVGSNIRNHNACATFKGDCHSCVLAGCIPERENCVNPPNKSERDIETPTYQEVFERAKLCQDTLGICTQIVNTNASHKFVMKNKNPMSKNIHYEY